MRITLAPLVFALLPACGGGGGGGAPPGDLLLAPRTGYEIAVEDNGTVRSEPEETRCGQASPTRDVAAIFSFDLEAVPGGSVSRAVLHVQRGTVLRTPHAIYDRLHVDHIDGTTHPAPEYWSGFVLSLAMDTFDELEDEYVLDVTDAVNQDLLDGRGHSTFRFVFREPLGGIHEVDDYRMGLVNSSASDPAQRPTLAVTP